MQKDQGDETGPKRLPAWIDSVRDGRKERDSESLDGLLTWVNFSRDKCIRYVSRQDGTESDPDDGAWRQVASEEVHEDSEEEEGRGQRGRSRDR